MILKISSLFCKFSLKGVVPKFITFSKKKKKNENLVGIFSYLELRVSFDPIGSNFLDILVQWAATNTYLPTTKLKFQPKLIAQNNKLQFGNQYLIISLS